jgi:hypothetical protein
MSSRVLQIFSVVVVFALALSFAACGGDSGASQEEIDRARKEGIAKARQEAKINDIQKQLKSLKNGSTSKSTPPSSGPSSAPRRGSTSCGGSLSVGPNTTCGFAANVEADYYSEIGSGAGSVYSYSPTTTRYYTMYCTAGTPHVCTGGNNASVYFP